ncbi:MAG: T9SS type A sorting domain-containing protein [Bacteroidota bacterium]
MNYFSSKLFSSLCLVLLLCLSAQPALAQSCSNSSLTLNGVNVLGGGLFELDVRLCVGGGILGTTLGAGNRTNTFAFSFSGTGIVVSSFTASVSSDSTLCLANGMLAGPQPSLNADEAVLYVPSGCDFNCISSTAVCGLPHSDCKDYLFTVNLIPDSIRAYGIEGAGNPFGGCLNISGMLIDFTAALDVEWGVLSSQWQADQLQLQWQTNKEENNDYFIVERSFDLIEWESRGQVASQGNSDSPQQYEFFDEANPLRTYYRVKQIDQDGQYSYSSRIAVSPFVNGLKVYPNPSADYFTISGLANGYQQISLFNQMGQEVLQRSISDQDQLQIGVSELPRGIYLVRVKGSLGSWQERIIVE